MNLRHSFVTVALFALLGAGNSATAQETEAQAYCFDCFDDIEFGLHYACPSFGFGWSGPTHCFQWQMYWFMFSHIAGDCDGGAENPDALVASLSKSESTELVRLIQEQSGRVEYNAGRKALQVRSCAGRGIVAHIPLRQSQLAVLNAMAAAMPRATASADARHVAAAHW